MENFAPFDHYLPQNQMRWYQLKLLLYEHSSVACQWENLVGRKILISKTPERKTKSSTIIEFLRNLVVLLITLINLHTFNVIAHHWSNIDNWQLTGFFMITTMTLNGSTVLCSLSLSVPLETSENLWISYVFRMYWKKSVAWNGWRIIPELIS